MIEVNILVMLTLAVIQVGYLVKDYHIIMILLVLFAVFLKILIKKQ